MYEIGTILTALARSVVVHLPSGSDELGFAVSYHVNTHNISGLFHSSNSAPKCSESEQMTPDREGSPKLWFGHIAQ
jgi:hypothetical protein